MENGTLRMGILKTKGLRPLVQNRFPFATKMPIRTIPFSKIGVWKETTKVGENTVIPKNELPTRHKIDGLPIGRVGLLLYPFLAFITVGPTVLDPVYQVT